MGIFRKATRLGGRVAKNAARQIVMPEDEKSKKSKGDKSAESAAPQHSDAEYDELQEKYNALMTEKWKEYYKTSCDGECETCEYYDWCPDDFDGVFEDETPAEDAKVESAAAEGEGAVAPDVDEGAEALRPTRPLKSRSKRKTTSNSPTRNVPRRLLPRRITKMAAMATAITASTTIGARQKRKTKTIRFFSRASRRVT